MTKKVLSWLEHLKSKHNHMRCRKHLQSPNIVMSLLPSRYLRQSPLRQLVQKIGKEPHAQRRLRSHSIANARAAYAAEAANDMRRAAGEGIQEVCAGGDFKAGFG